MNNGIYSSKGLLATKADFTVMDKMQIGVRDHCLIVTTPAECRIGIVRADGIVFNVDLHVGVNTVDLPRGLYIVAGKKVAL